MKLTITAVLAFATVPLFSQTNSQVAAKPATPEIKTSVAAPVVLDTAKIWRLNSKALALRKQADETPQARAATAAEADVQAEYQALAQQCSSAGLTLATETDPASPRKDDLVCKAQPPAAKEPPKEK